MNFKSLFTTKVVVVLCFFLISTVVLAQKKSVIYIGTNGKLTTLDHAIYMQKIDSKSSRASVQTFFLKDSNWEKICSEQYKKLNDSTFQIKGNGKNIPKTVFRTFIEQPDKTWKFKDKVKGIVTTSGYAKSVVPLILHGEITEYYPSGNKKSVSQYNNNELVSNKNWSENGDEYIDNVFYSVDTEPTFSRGPKVLQDHILKRYKDAGIDITSIYGSIVVGFVVMENGTIDGIKIMKGLGPNINDITRESFSTLLGPWTPAKLNNQKVRYFMVFPINFINKESHIDFAEMRNGILDFGAY
jgi:hypothetical protein